jgi:hypothetical protein
MYASNNNIVLRFKEQVRSLLFENNHHLSNQDTHQIQSIVEIFYEPEPYSSFGSIFHWHPVLKT